MFAKRFFAMLLVCASAATTAYADDKDAVTQFTNDLGHQALTIISDKSASKEEKTQRLEDLFQKNVDIAWIGKFALGRFWRDTTDEQKKAYLENYKNFLLKHYTSNLSEFTDADFAVTKVVPEARGGYVVTMKIKRPKAEDTIVDYTIRNQDNAGFKVYDITVEGVSMITTQRSEFSSVASQKGVDYLIAQLAERSKTEQQDIKP